MWIKQLEVDLMHIEIIIELVNLLMNEIKVKNARLEYQLIDLPHLIYELMICFELILLFDSDVVEHLDDFPVESEFCVVDGDVSECVLAQHCPLGDQVFHDFGTTFGRGQVQGSPVISVE